MPKWTNEKIKRLGELLQLAREERLEWDRPDGTASDVAILAQRLLEYEVLLAQGTFRAGVEVFRRWAMLTLADWITDRAERELDGKTLHEVLETIREKRFL